MQGAGGIIWAISQVFLSSLCCCRFESGEQDIVRVNAFHLKRIARVPTVQGSSTPSIKSHPESIVQEGSGEIFPMLVAFPYCWTCTLKRIIKQLPLIGGSRYATRAFATPIFVGSATPIFVASATPYFRISATQTAATPKILF